MSCVRWIRTAISMAILLLLTFFVLSLGLGRQAALVPMYVLVPSLFLAVLQVIRDATAVRPAAPKDAAQVGSVRHESLAIAAIFGLPVCVVALGFGLGVPAYLFCYLRWFAGEQIRYAMIVSLAGYAVTAALFELVLELDLNAGLVWS